MVTSAPLIEIWRGDFLESRHRGHVAVCDVTGGIVDAWGDPGHVILPRSSCKMVQALPLVTSGAAAKFGLGTEQLALACASHQGAGIHTVRVEKWLSALKKSDDDLRCGTQWPNDIPARNGLIKSDETPCRYHNNCSGKHCGFLTLSDHLGAGPEYHDPDHPVQRAVLDAFETTTGETSPGFGVDGCSAPNFATTVHGLARAAAFFANATDVTSMGRAAISLRDAMIAHPDLVAGETRACTELMHAAPGVALKTGAEAVFLGILPKQGLGIALKIEDGSFRGSEAAITHLLAKYGALDTNHPSAKKRLGPMYNWDGLEIGGSVASANFA